MWSIPAEEHKIKDPNMFLIPREDKPQLTDMSFGKVSISKAIDKMKLSVAPSLVGITSDIIMMFKDELLE